MLTLPFKSSQDECGLIRLQIEFALDMWVTHHHSMLYHHEISIIKGDTYYLGSFKFKLASIKLLFNLPNRHKQFWWSRQETRHHLAHSRLP